MPVEQVFALLSDHNKLGKVLGAPVKRIKDGAGDVNGVGSVRTIGFAPLALEETVVDMVPNESIDYVISKNGGPVLNHYGRLVFSKTPRGSRVEWTITFESYPVVGAVIEKALGIGIARGLKKIA